LDVLRGCSKLKDSLRRPATLCEATERSGVHLGFLAGYPKL